MNRILLGDNLALLPTLPAAFARLVYIDPPFNTRTVQKRRRVAVTPDAQNGTRVGFHGRTYAQRITAVGAYRDDYGDGGRFCAAGHDGSDTWICTNDGG